MDEDLERLRAQVERVGAENAAREATFAADTQVMLRGSVPQTWPQGLHLCCISVVARLSLVGVVEW